MDRFGSLFHRRFRLGSELIYFSTASSVCQELFSFLSSFVRRVLCFSRSSLHIILRLSPFVNPFFHIFSPFFGGARFCARKSQEPPSVVVPIGTWRPPLPKAELQAKTAGLQLPGNRRKPLLRGTSTHLPGHRPLGQSSSRDAVVLLNAGRRRPERTAGRILPWSMPLTAALPYAPLRQTD